MPEPLSGPSSTKIAANDAKNASVGRKLKQVLEITLDGSFKDSLSYLSSFYTENTAKDRKNLRGLLEKQVLDLRQEFLQELSKVNEAFQTVQADVADLSTICDEVTVKLHNTQQDASTLLTRAAVLQAELKDVQTKEEQVHDFLQKFQLTTAEKAHLKGDINDNFFATLAKVSQIHKDCKDLMNVNTQQAGLDIMEEMYMFQLSAYEKLFKHTHKLCMELMLADTADISTNFVTSMNALRERTALWSECMGEITKGRRNALVRNFFDALTRGTAGSRPIEIQAHDPLRYVGDMLAWVHQSVAEENELMSHFFPEEKNKSAAVQKPDPDGLGLEGLELTKQDVLDQIFEGLCKHLRARIEQVLNNNTSTAVGPTGGGNMVMFFSLENVLDFYSHAIPHIFPQNAALAILLKDMKLNTMKHLFDLLKSLSEALTSQPPVVPSDLSAPAVVHETLSQLVGMMETLSSSSLIPAEEREVEFTHVLSAVVEPLVTLSRMTDSLDRISRYIVAINTLNTVRATLTSYDFTQAMCKKLQGLINTEVENLIRDQVDGMCSQFGFLDKLEKISLREKSEQPEPLSMYPTTSQTAMKETISAFYQYLFSIGRPVLPQCEKLMSLRLRDDVQSEVSKLLAQAYERLYNEICDPSNQYNNPTTEFLYHSPEKVRMLLEVESPTSLLPTTAATLSAPVKREGA
eukprot:TRINITY_DN37826_c0_g1_i1.p1 TRINITY_DN37826_c0_g1~~TRINITY_DN37826_c0_g1_i1.p1  ORF type:complete len:690 (+),score=79.40 TRINITY_DN37826_c0_g1_i1:45-2114(+)